MLSILSTCLAIYANICDSKGESGPTALKIQMSYWVIIQVLNVYLAEQSCILHQVPVHCPSFSPQFRLHCYWALFLPYLCCVHLISHYHRRWEMSLLWASRSRQAFANGESDIILCGTVSLSFPGNLTEKGHSFLTFYLFLAISHRFTLITIYIFLHINILILISKLSHHHIYGLGTLYIFFNAVSLRSVKPAVAVFLDYNWIHFSSPEAMC